MHAFQPWSPQIYINPLYLQPSAGRVRQVFNPATLEPIGQIPLCNKADLQLAIDAAETAYRLWRRQDAKHQQTLLRQLAEHIDSASQLNHEITRLMSLELGLSLADAASELANCAAIFRHYAELAQDATAVSGPSAASTSLSHMRYEPYGVTVHILPFTLGVLTLCRTVAAALAAGCSCIVKPAPSATLSTLAFMQHFNALPEGLVSCIPGDAATGQWLLQSSGTHAVAFTGSVAAGSAVAVTCAELLKPCVIDSAGRGSTIISRHAQLEAATSWSVAAAFNRGGQSCLSTQQFLVIDDIHDRFVERLVEKTHTLNLECSNGRFPPGPMINEVALLKVARLVNDALAKGAKRIVGEQPGADRQLGWFYPPTLLTNVDNSMAITQEECLGPVAVIRRVRDFSDALQQANNCAFSLETTVFSSDLGEALLAVEHLQSSRTWINSPMIADETLTSTGWEMSKVASGLGSRGLDAFRRMKNVILSCHSVP